MDEFELIRRYFTSRSESAPGTVVGIGDDGAVLRVEPGRELVVVVDTIVEGVHYPRGMDPFDVGWRAAAVNLSDIAAMGATPRWMTLALTLAGADEDWLEGFAGGLHAAAAGHGVELVGGDTTSGPVTVASVEILGEVEAGRALLRSGAKPGDGIWVTGSTGDAAAGLKLMNDGDEDGWLCGRFRRPQARVAYGRLLAGRASAAIDVSDGLYGDLGKLLAASGAGAEIDLDRLPVSDALRGRFDEAQYRRFALSGGDDYELVFTISGEPPALAGLAVTRIGAVTAGEGIVCRSGGEVVPWNDGGYSHFQ